MNKFYGKLGYISYQETRPGVWEQVRTERECIGDIQKNTRRFEAGEAKLDNITITNKFRVLQDPYAFEHLQDLKYLRWNNNCWAVSSVDIDYPGMIITIGGIYNEELANP